MSQGEFGFVMSCVRGLVSRKRGYCRRPVVASARGKGAAVGDRVYVYAGPMYACEHVVVEVFGRLMTCERKGVQVRVHVSDVERLEGCQSVN